MKTSELIKQAEELLGKPEDLIDVINDKILINGLEPKDGDVNLIPESGFIFYTFARNHMQELIDIVKKYEEALNFYADDKNWGPAGPIVDQRGQALHLENGYMANKALGDE